MIKDAMFWEKHGDRIRCSLCPHNCNIGEGQYGLCSVRTNIEGNLKTINYGEITAIALDPIEKKPLYHFCPGSKILSVGSFGCNFFCGFCQNYSIAHYRAESRYFSPEELIETCRQIDDNIGIAFTYNEPSIWYEYVCDTAKKLKEVCPQYKVVLVTNGYIQEKPLTKILPYIDAMNIDLKSFRQDYYNKICGGDIKYVLETIEKCYDKCHIEITTLLVNGLNDTVEEVERIAVFLSSLDKNIPLHLTRYFPNYKIHRPPTDIDVMQKARGVASKYLNYVYLGNV
ncbi:pyruvate formate lyase activating enzyme [Lutispora thermophila DSM 19022]|uniref:Pyruvate formate lyase activating enzyme n=1 Tax=Lutispora thermophila DSM 19022 TaxID=1122184 RepID=A0A1M6ARA3_9FIRM|nr:AmmeMemoRadiSam system radical SAM enzyme [Lutispora thermophila]SHI38957.1 pyruvate formate lyase activating enzyme [Lutispora thermophila DSM 19022]